MSASLDTYLSPQDLVFRDQVRQFLRDHLTPEMARAIHKHDHPTKEVVQAWHRILFRQGWVAPSWPQQYGGPGWTAMQRYIFDEECAAADAPVLHYYGLNMVGPVIYTYGSEEQKARYLPGILSGEEFWCQGYSEPGAGSDLASLRTQARRDGDHYVVNGSKIWTSHADHADMIFCLVRTDPQAKAQRGITFLLIDMKTPGITVRPIISIDGSHVLNEVFLEDVRVPVANRIGDENNGWTYAKFLLGNERSTIANVAASRRRLERLKEIAAGEPDGEGGRLIDSPRFAHRLAGLEIELLALAYSDLVFVQGGGNPALTPSILKLRGSEIMQGLGQAAVEALGPMAMPYEPSGIDESHQSLGAPDYALGRVEDYLFRRAATIYGGSSETQKNILAKLIFGF